MPELLKNSFFNENKDEIYTRQEIDFISSVCDVVIFSEFHKETRQGMIPCRVFAVRNIRVNILDFSIAFTKIVNKVSDGFNICIMVSKDGIIFTCGAYDEFMVKNYCISNIIKNYEQMEEMYDKLMYSSAYNKFIDYYSYVSESIRFKTDIPDFFIIKRTMACLCIHGGAMENRTSHRS